MADVEGAGLSAHTCLVILGEPLLAPGDVPGTQTVVLRVTSQSCRWNLTLGPQSAARLTIHVNYRQPVAIY